VTELCKNCVGILPAGILPQLKPAPEYGMMIRSSADIFAGSGDKK
jgi:hypothetical protein